MSSEEKEPYFDGPLVTPNSGQNLFYPGSAPHNSLGQMPMHQQHAALGPAFYNPNEFGAAATGHVAAQPWNAPQIIPNAQFQMNGDTSAGTQAYFGGVDSGSSESSSQHTSPAHVSRHKVNDVSYPTPQSAEPGLYSSNANSLFTPPNISNSEIYNPVMSEGYSTHSDRITQNFLLPPGGASGQHGYTHPPTTNMFTPHNNMDLGNSTLQSYMNPAPHAITPPMSNNMPDIAGMQFQTPEQPLNDNQYESVSPINPMDLHNGMPAQPLSQDTSDQSYMNMAYNTNYGVVSMQVADVNAYVTGEYQVDSSNNMMIPASSSGHDYDILHSQGTWKDQPEIPELDQAQSQFTGAGVGQANSSQTEDHLQDAAQRLRILNIEENLAMPANDAEAASFNERQDEQQLQEHAPGGNSIQNIIPQDNSQESLHNFIVDNHEDTSQPHQDGLSLEPPSLQQLELETVRSDQGEAFAQENSFEATEPQTEQSNVTPFLGYGYGLIPPSASGNFEAENRQSYESHDVSEAAAAGAALSTNLLTQPSVDLNIIHNEGETTLPRTNEATLEQQNDLPPSSESPIPADGLHPKQADILEPSAHQFASPTSAFESRFRSQSTGSNNSNASSHISAHSQPNRISQNHYLSGSSYMPAPVANVQPTTRQSTISTPSNPFSTNTMHSSHVGDRSNNPPIASVSAIVQPIPAIPDIVRPLPSETGGENLRTGATVPMSSNQSLHSQVLYNRTTYSPDAAAAPLFTVAMTTRSQPDVIQSPPEVASAFLHPSSENTRTVMALKTSDIPEASGVTPVSVPNFQPGSVNSDPYLSRSLYNAHSDPPPTTTSAINQPLAAAAATTVHAQHREQQSDRNLPSDPVSPPTSSTEDVLYRESGDRSSHQSGSRRQDEDSRYYESRDPYIDRRDSRYDDQAKRRQDDYGRRDNDREDTRYRRDDGWDSRYEDHTPRSRNEHDSRPSSRHGDPAQYSRPYGDRGYGREHDHRDPYYRDPYYNRYQEYDRRDPYYSSYDRHNERYYDQYHRRIPDAWQGRGTQPYSEHDQYYNDYYHDQRRTAEEDTRSVYSEKSRATEHEPATEQEWHQRHSYAEPATYEYSYAREGQEHRYYEDSIMDESTLSNTYYDESWQRLPQVPARQTPAKFSTAHTIARFGPGGHLIRVLPNRPTDNQPSTVEIHSVEILLQGTEAAEDLRSYAGPLSKDETHKKDVLQFATQRSSESMKDINLLDRRSTALIWDFLALLVRQNGSVLGTDIAELLTKDHSGDFKLLQSPLEASKQRQIALQQRAATPNSIPEEQGGTVSSPVSDQSDSAASNHIAEISSTIERNCCRFRELLLHGRKKDALEWAMKSGLWGHALLLASKTDNRTHAQVMLRFANSLPINDPLQTVYQLMSGRQPAAATCVSEEGWGDWRPHLAMILSNPTASASLDMRAVLTMGDTLVSRGLLHAAHFCYLMSSTPLGYYGRPNSKMVLLGANHTLAFDEFASFDSIRRTEIYEYAISLGKSQRSNSSSTPLALPALQLYKFIYACKLAEYGMNAQAFHYCERIAKSVCRNPTAYSATLVNELLNISDRLRHHDPQIEAGMVDAGNLQWVERLRNVNTQFQTGRIVPRTNVSSSLLTVSNTPSVISSSPITEDNDDIRFSAHTPEQEEDVTDSRAPAGPHGPTNHYGQSQFDQQGYQMQQQVQMYSSSSVAQDPGPPAMMVPATGVQQHNQNYSQEQSQIPSQDFQGTQQTMYQPTQFMQPSAQPNEQPSLSVPGFDHLANQANPLASGSSNISSQQPTFQNQNSYGFNNADQTQQPNIEVESSERNEQEDYYDYMSHSQQAPPHKVHHPDHDHGRSISPRIRSVSQSSQRSRASTLKGYDRNTPTAMNNYSDKGRRSRTTSENSAGKRSRKTSGEPQNHHHQSKSKDDNKENQDKVNNKKTSSWSLFGLFSRKKPNQVHLPDDTEKEITWDDELGRWVNKNASAEELAPPAPPPMDNIHSNPAPQFQQQMHTNQIHNQLSNQPLAPTPASGEQKLTANRFSLKNLGGNRVMYKNAFSSSSSPAVAPAPLIPLPGMQNPVSSNPTGFMIPNPVAVSQPRHEDVSPAATSTPMHSTNNNTTDQQNIQMFSPGNTPYGSSNDFRQPFNHGGSSSSSSISSSAHEVRNLTRITENEQQNNFAPQPTFAEKDNSASSGPTMFFNPSQFTAPPELSHQTASSGRDNALTRRARGKGYPGRR